MTIISRIAPSAVLAFCLLSTCVYTSARPQSSAPRPLQNGPWRVIQFGDSHTAADSLQLAVRGQLQQMYGNAGIGMFLPCATKHPGQERLWVSRCSPGWTLQTRPDKQPEEFVGLPGLLLETSQAGETIHVEAPFRTFRAFFMKRPGGGRVRFFVNGGPIGDLDLSSPRLEPVPFIGSAPRSGVQRLDIQTLSGPVRLLSMTLEEDTSGVIYSPLGVVGERAENLLHINEEFFSRQLAWEAPDVVLLAYGTNESSGWGVDEAAHAALMGDLVNRIRRAAPGARIVLVGPPDRGRSGISGSLPTLDGVIRATQNAAREKNAAFLDLRQAMGGEGTASRWAASSPPLAQPDRTHFTPAGYQRVGSYIAAAIGTAMQPLVNQGASRLTATAATGSPIIYIVRAGDGRMTITNDPEMVRVMLVQGGTLVGN